MQINEALNKCANLCNSCTAIVDMQQLTKKKPPQTSHLCNPIRAIAVTRGMNQYKWRATTTTTHTDRAQLQ